MKFLKKPSLVWLGILSEFCVNLAASLTIVIFIEPILSPLKTLDDFVVLTYKIVLGMLFLLLAKKFREDSKK